MDYTQNLEELYPQHPEAILRYYCINFSVREGRILAEDVLFNQATLRCETEIVDVTNWNIGQFKEWIGY